MRGRATTVRGFTLIEVMIVVVIVGILASIAYPAYQRYIRESRRADAQAYMMELALRQERYRASNNLYGNDGDIGVTDTVFYDFDITDASISATTYTITASAQGSQSDDTSCLTLTLNQAGAKGLPGCWKN